MRKSSDITKYDPDWQVIRAKIKGPNTSLENKIIAALDYFNQTQTIDAWERVVNWLEGLQMGYRNSNDIDAIKDITHVLQDLQRNKPVEKQQDITTDDILFKLANYSYQDRLLLWKDLFNRNKKWLQKGYFHKEHNAFMDIMYELFMKKHEQIPDTYSKEKLDELRQKSQTITNTHKFFF